MSNTKYGNQLLTGASLDVSVAAQPVNSTDTLTGAFSKVQSQLFELGAGNYIGIWDASTNTPTLSNATIEAAGNWYNVIKAGTVDFGAGAISFTTNDAVYSTGVVYAKRDLPGTSIELPNTQLLIGQVDGLAAPKTMSNDATIGNDGTLSLAFESRTSVGTFDGTLHGGGVQYFTVPITVQLADMVIGRQYVLYNTDTTTHTFTIAGASAAVIGGDALTSGLVQTVNGGTSYTITRQNATTVLIEN